MKRILLICLALNVPPLSAQAQRDAPISESHLASLSIYHQDDSTLAIDLLYKKEGGPPEHTEQEMYIIAYMQRDESRILKLMSAPINTKGSVYRADQIDREVAVIDSRVASLSDKKLIAILDSKVARRINPDVSDWDVNQDRSQKASASDTTASLKKINTLAYKFALSNEKLFQVLAGLASFNSHDVQENGNLRYFGDKLKVLAFVPVNMSKYATKVPRDLKTKRDLVSLLYFRPLPYELTLVKKLTGGTCVHVN